ncbi:MAG: putative Glucan 1,3-beta-glucosidase [Candidatus Saccharibacteria bacterium]|nr:putative Glucan 1,3-beta-glucosidase [Candidatus Saccharibacteria bacterium]
MTYGIRLRGVNLGGWLILEKWMTPSLFTGTKAVDEYTLMQTSGAKEKIERHRKTFITEADFKWLQKNGINAVRIPIGYWIFDGDGPFTPAIKYLDWAIQMADKYQLKVLIDLHGLKGSQNGKDHSGRIGKNEWHKHKEYRQESIDILEKIARRYYDEPAVWGIEMINEPKFGIVQWKLRRFYKHAYDRLRAVARPGTVIVFHDAFTPRLLTGALWPDPRYPVVMDIHWYQFGSIWRKHEKLDDYFTRVWRRAWLLMKLQSKQPIIIGEWSVVLTQEALAGRSPQEAQQAFQRHGALQLETYEFAFGWFYWSYRTEERGIWNFRALIEDGRISLK